MGKATSAYLPGLVLGELMAQVPRSQQRHALVPSDPEPRGLCLRPACSLNSSLRTQQGPQQQTDKVPAMSGLSAGQRAFSLDSETEGLETPSTPRALAQTEGIPSCGQSWLSAGSRRRLQAGPESAAGIEESSACIQPAASQQPSRGGQHGQIGS